MTLPIQPKLHLGNEVHRYLAPTWTAPSIAQAPFRSVSVGERVYQEVVQGRHKPPLFHASTETPKPLLVALLRNTTQLMDAQIHTTDGKTYTGREVLADAAVRMVKADGEEILGLAGSALATPQGHSAGILTGGDLLDSMSTWPFLVGVGSMAVRPKGTQVLWDLFDRAGSIKTLTETVADIKGQISSLKAKKVYADINLRTAESQLADRKGVVQAAQKYSRKSQGYGATVVRQTIAALKTETKKADAIYAQQNIRSNHLAHQIKNLEGLLIRAQQDLAGYVGAINIFLIKTEPNQSQSESESKSKPKRAKPK